tara:strand:+ start:2163 stop:2951 length:789 start_codon:yes stop_codon:yes gene_type:complete
MTEPNASEGQVETDSTGTTVEAPRASEGHPVTSSQTTSIGPGETDAESFFDPKDLEGKPELQSAYKHMQGRFTKAMQGVKGNQPKIDAYDGFLADPVGTLHQIAAQQGYKVVPSDGKTDSEDWQPNSWGDVMSRARNEVLRDMGPVLDEVRNLKKQNVETYLDSNYADWRVYEDDMVSNLQAHPSLASDPDKLYQISVPSEILQAKATKEALAKIKGVGEAGKVSGARRTQETSQGPSGPLSLDQAVTVAKQRLADQGVVLA